MIKAAFFDVDGTLISHRISDIPASTIQSLYALKRAGILIFLATGRHRCELANLPLHRFPFDGYITLTGQICYDSDFRPFYLCPFSDDDRDRIVKEFLARRIPLVLVNENGLYINRVDETVIRTQQAISTRVPDLGAYTGEEIYMATAFGDDAQIAELTSRFSGCRPSRWHENAVDFIPAGGGKVEGMKKVQELHGIKREEIIAFGDGENDIDMIQYAGIGVAMGNGSELLKAAADFVTASVDEEGVPFALRHFQV